MINLSGIPIKDRINYILANAWANKDLYRCEKAEICVIHALNIVNLDSGAETISSYIGVENGGLFYYHDTKLAYAINLSHNIITPIMLVEGDILQVQIYASAADTPVAISYEGMRYLRLSKVKE